jgi:hypothetical protein
MNGRRMRLERIRAPIPTDAETPLSPKPRSDPKTAETKVISLADLKKK